MVTRTHALRNQPRGTRRRGRPVPRPGALGCALPAFQKMIDALAEHVAILDERSDIIAVNTAWQRFADANGLRSPNYGLGMNYLQVCEKAAGAEQAQVVARGLRRLLNRREGDFHCDYPCHSPSEKRWFQLSTTCFQDRSRLYLVLSHQNVTELKQNQQDLRTDQRALQQRVSESAAALAQTSGQLENAIWERSEAEGARAMLAAIVESSQDPIISKDLDGRITSWNASAERLFGYSAKEALGQPGSLIIPPDKQAEVEDLMARLRRGERIEHLETVRVARNGRRIDVALAISPVRDAAGVIRGVSEMVHDITRRKQAEAELRETIEELEHFSYALLHDMRAPLRAMISFASLIETQCGTGFDQEQVLSYLGRIKASSERMDHLVRDALNYTRVLRRDFPLRPVQPLPLLHGLIESYPELWPHQAQIHLAPNLPAVLANEGVLTECFSNLLRNAVKFVAPGQTPDIRVWAEEVAGSGQTTPASPPSQTGQTGQTANPPPHKIRIWVQDNGIGIPPEEYESIFDMFRQVHPNSVFPGTGIGLAIVRKGLSRIGGRVGVESTPGQGSRFWVELRAVASGP